MARALTMATSGRITKAKIIVTAIVSLSNVFVGTNIFVVFLGYIQWCKPPVLGEDNEIVILCWPVRSGTKGTDYQT